MEIRQGEVVSIVGPSGSGKSTLLHILGTLDKADTGTVSMNNTLVNALTGKELAAFRNKHIGFVFQFHHLLPEFTALENVCIPGWLAGRKKNDVKEEAISLLKMLGLSHRMENKPNQLSGGEQQRVAVARALINKPDIVMADEPTGNLDTVNAKELHQLFFRLRDEFRQTFLIVTHNEELAQLSDRVLHMRDGKIV
jgi:lipoprotein-releasing system ATP-binding protein